MHRLAAQLAAHPAAAGVVVRVLWREACAASRTGGVEVPRARIVVSHAPGYTALAERELLRLRVRQTPPDDLDVLCLTIDQERVQALGLGR